MIHALDVHVTQMLECKDRLTFYPCIADSGSNVSDFTKKKKKKKKKQAHMYYYRELGLIC